MRKSISVNKKSRGRPKKAGGVDPVSAVRLPADLTQQVDTWGEGRGLSRSDALRRLVELGLTVRTKIAKTEARPAVDDQKQRAREMAGSVIDGMGDNSISPDDRASRKRRLVKGPEEFENVRRDRPIRK